MKIFRVDFLFRIEYLKIDLSTKQLVFGDFSNRAWKYDNIEEDF